MPPKKKQEKKPIAKNGDLRSFFGASTSTAPPVVPSTASKPKGAAKETAFSVGSDDAEEPATNEAAVDANGFLKRDLNRALANSTNDRGGSTDSSRGKGKGKAPATWVDSDSDSNDDDDDEENDDLHDRGFLQSDLEAAVVESLKPPGGLRDASQDATLGSISISEPLNAPNSGPSSSSSSASSSSSIPVSSTRVRSTTTSSKRVLVEVSSSAAKRQRPNTSTPTSHNVIDSVSSSSSSLPRFANSSAQNSLNDDVERVSAITANAKIEIKSPTSDVPLNDDGSVPNRDDGDDFADRADATAMEVDELEDDDEEVDELKSDDEEVDELAGDEMLKETDASELGDQLRRITPKPSNEAPRIIVSDEQRPGPSSSSSSHPRLADTSLNAPGSSKKPTLPLPTIFTKKGVPLKAMSTDADAVRRRERRKEQQGAQPMQIPVEAQELVNARRRPPPFDRTVINLPSTVPTDAAACVNITKAKSDWYRDGDGRTKQPAQDWQKLATYSVPTLQFLAEMSINPTGFDLEGAEARGVLRRCQPASGAERDEKKQDHQYLRHRRTSRKDLLRLLRLLDALAPQDAALNQALREIILRMVGEWIREFYIGFSIATTALGRWLQSLMQSTSWDRFKQRLDAGGDLLRSFDVSEWVEFNHIYPDRLQGFSPAQLHELRRWGGQLEQICHDAGRGGVIWNVAPGGLIGPWYLRSAGDLLDVMNETRTILPLPDQHPISPEIEDAVTDLVDVIEASARSDGVALDPEFVRRMRQHMMPTGVTAHGRVAIATILDAPREIDLRVQAGFWTCIPGRGPGLQRVSLNTVYGRNAPLLPQQLDATSIAKHRFSFMDMRPYGNGYGLGKTALFTVAYILAQNPVVLWIQSQEVYNLLDKRYTDFRGCRTALTWAQNPDIRTLDHAIATLNKFWDEMEFPYDANALCDSRRYGDHIGEMFTPVVGEKTQVTFVKRHLGAEKHTTVTAKEEELLFGCTDGLRYVTEVCAHEISSEPTDIEVGVLKETIQYAFTQTGLQQMTREIRDELNSLLSAFATVRNAARYARETAAADVQGPEARELLDLTLSNRGSHMAQIANERALRAPGPPGDNPTRLLFAEWLLGLFLECKKNNTRLPFEVPPSICPFTRPDAFLAFVLARWEGCILMRSANQLKGFKSLSPAQLQAKRKHWGDVARARAMIVGTLQPARTAEGLIKVMLEQLTLESNPLKGSLSWWQIGCEKCPTNERWYGNQNTKHQCPNTVEGQTVVRKPRQLHHVSLATPYHILHFNPNPALRDYINNPANGLYSECINDWLPDSIDFASLGYTPELYPDAVVVCREEDLDDDDTPQLLQWQAVIAFLIARHTHRPIDEYHVSDADPSMVPVVNAMVEGDKIVVETSECKGCYFCGILAVHESFAGVGERIRSQHSRRNGSVVRPPRTYLPESYAELEFTVHTPPRPGNKGLGPCSKLAHVAPVVSRRILSLFDFPLAWQIKFATAVIFVNDSLHKFFKGWTIEQLFGWRQPPY